MSPSASRCWPIPTTWPSMLPTFFTYSFLLTMPSNCTLSCIQSLLLQFGLWVLNGLALLHVMPAGNRRRALVEVTHVGWSGLLFALALAAVQIVPTVELVPRSFRAAGYDFSIFSGWSIHPIDF